MKSGSSSAPAAPRGKVPVPEANRKRGGAPDAVLEMLMDKHGSDEVAVHNELVRRGYDPDK